MRDRSNTALRASTALLLTYGLLVLLAMRADAQSTDKPPWSIFAGRTTSSAAGTDDAFNFPAENFGVGGGLEFKPSLFPVPLRATLSYDKFRSGPSTTLKATSLTLDAVFRPLPAVRGFRPYLLGGLCVGTVSPSGRQVLEGGALRVIPIARTTALELDTGLGLEFRRLFAEYRHSPYGVLGDAMPLRLGFRF